MKYATWVPLDANTQVVFWSSTSNINMSLFPLWHQTTNMISFNHTNVFNLIYKLGEACISCVHGRILRPHVLYGFTKLTPTSLFGYVRQWKGRINRIVKLVEVQDFMTITNHCREIFEIITLLISTIMFYGTNDIPWNIPHGILSIPHNNVMYLNDVMMYKYTTNQ